MVCVIVNFFSANKTVIQMVNILIMTCLFAALMRPAHHKIFRAPPLTTGLPNTRWAARQFFVTSCPVNKGGGGGGTCSVYLFM